jgi:hypothetical protein
MPFRLLFYSLCPNLGKCSQLFYPAMRVLLIRRVLLTKRADTVGEPPLLVFNDPNRGSCVGATRRSAVDGVVEVPCRGLRLMIASFRVKYYIKYFL